MELFDALTPELIFGLSAIVTPLATIALVWVTVVLARATKQMAQASTQPLVTATIEPNIWSMLHCDLVVENSGNSPAYDININISPEITRKEDKKDSRLPLTNISVLRPGQNMKSFLTGANDVLGQVYTIEVSWKRSPSGQSLETIVYDHCLPEGLNRLGAWSPEIQIAEQIKNFREDWRFVSSGFKKLSVNVFDSEDRKQEMQKIDEIRKRGEEG